MNIFRCTFCFDIYIFRTWECITYVRLKIYMYQNEVIILYPFETYAKLTLFQILKKCYNPNTP